MHVLFENENIYGRPRGECGSRIVFGALLVYPTKTSLHVHLYLT